MSLVPNVPALAANTICTCCTIRKTILSTDNRTPSIPTPTLCRNNSIEPTQDCRQIDGRPFCCSVLCSERNSYPKRRQSVSILSIRSTGTKLTFFSNFSINSPSCVLNFDPTEMKFNLPRDEEFPLANKTFSSGLADSWTRNSKDACSASLFFSMNWFCGWGAALRKSLRFDNWKWLAEHTYSVVTNSTGEMSHQKAFFVTKRSMGLQSRQTWKRQSLMIVPGAMHFRCEMGERWFW